MVPSEEVILSMTRHGYIKRTSIRSFNASGVEDIGLKDGDSLLKHQEVNTQDTVLVFTNKGRYLFIPVHKLADIRWKELGQHVSQIVLSKKMKWLLMSLMKRTLIQMHFMFCDSKWHD